MDSGAFNQSGIQSISFAPNSTLGTIPHTVFENCWNLTSIEIQSSVKWIGEQRFQSSMIFTTNKKRCIPILPQFKIDSDTIFRSGVGVGVFEASGIQSVAFDVTILSLRLFAGCSNLSFIEIPSYVEEIQEDAFADTNLGTVIFAPNSKLQKIGKALFDRVQISYLLNCPLR